jgi:hypothetical protein
MPSICTKPPGKIREPAIGSLGQTAGSPCRIPARWRPGLVRRGWGRPCDSPTGRFALILQVGYIGGERAAKPGGGGRCGSKPGEGAACSEQPASVGAWVCARDDVGWLARRRRRAERGSRRGL